MASPQSRAFGGPRKDFGSEAEGEQMPPSNGLRTLFAAIDDLKEDRSYRELTSALKDVETLRSQLSNKEATIKQLELSREKERAKFEFTTESLVDEHHKRYTKLEAHRDELVNKTSVLRESVKEKDDARKVLEVQQNQMQAEIARVRADLHSSSASGREERQKYQKLELDFKAAEAQIDKLKVDVGHRENEVNKLREIQMSLEKRCNDMRQLLQTSDEELKRLQGLGVKLTTESLATTKERLGNLWREALYTVNKHFRFRLPEASEQSMVFWKRLKDVSSELEYVSNQSVPLPRRDSISSRNVRCALVLAWLMQLVDSELFQPNYIIPLESGIRNHLLCEALKDCRSESSQRAFLLSIFPEEQMRILDERAASVVNRVMCLIEGIIDTDKETALRSDLQRFVNLACTVWQAIQRLQDKFEPNMDYVVDESFDWEDFPFDNSEEESDDEGASVASDAVDEAVLVVFPRVYIAKDGHPKPVTPGIVLMKSQTVTAAHEVRSEAPKSPTFGRSPQNFLRDNRRRDSVIMDNTLLNRNTATFLGSGGRNRQLR